MKVLIDTCVIIDALQSRKHFESDAQEIFIAAANRKIIGFISAKAITDIYYLMHHYTHSDQKSREVLNKLLTLFDVLDTLGIDCRKAIPSPVSDFEDAVMIETAMRCEIDVIVTRNKEDFIKSNINVLSPKDFLIKLQSE